MARLRWLGGDEKGAQTVLGEPLIGGRQGAGMQVAQGGAGASEGWLVDCSLGWGGVCGTCPPRPLVCAPDSIAPVVVHVHASFSV